ncbi:MAG: hypothetical protein ACE5KZ_16275 [Candidatus Scalinduaceae bacterium]
MNIFDRFLVLIYKVYFCLINKLFPPRTRAVKRLAEIERYPKEALRQLEEEAPVEMRPGIMAGTEGLIQLTKTVEVELGISSDKEREELISTLEEQFLSVGDGATQDAHRYLEVKKRQDKIIMEKISVPFYDPAKQLLIRALYFDKELLKDMLRDAIRKYGLQE